MRDAETVLGIIQERGKQGLPLESSPNRYSSSTDSYTAKRDSEKTTSEHMRNVREQGKH